MNKKIDNRRKYPLIKKGDRFGKWTVTDSTLRKDPNKKAKAHCVEVTCDCGTVQLIITNKLYVGTSTQCLSCKAEESHRKYFKGVGELSESFMSRVKRGAVARNLEFDITTEYVWNLFLEQGRRCKLTNVPITLGRRSYTTDKNRIENYTASLDRIDSKKGYIEGNLQWVHKWINLIKMDFDQSEFIDLCRDVVDHCKSLQTYIGVRLDVEGLHFWPDAAKIEPTVAFLQHPHRHRFFIEAKKVVSHHDRDIELILFKRLINKYLHNKYFDTKLQLMNFKNNSCEMLANELCIEFGLEECSVFEDNEVGAIVSKTI